MKDDTRRSSRIARPGEPLPSHLADTLKSPEVAVGNCAASVSSNVDTVSIALRIDTNGARAVGRAGAML